MNFLGGHTGPPPPQGPPKPSGGPQQVNSAFKVMIDKTEFNERAKTRSRQNRAQRTKNLLGQSSLGGGPPMQQQQQQQQQGSFWSQFSSNKPAPIMPQQQQQQPPYGGSAPIGSSHFMTSGYGGLAGAGYGGYGANPGNSLFGGNSVPYGSNPYGNAYGTYGNAYGNAYGNNFWANDGKKGKQDKKNKGNVPRWMQSSEDKKKDKSKKKKKKKNWWEESDDDDSSDSSSSSSSSSSDSSSDSDSSDSDYTQSTDSSNSRHSKKKKKKELKFDRFGIPIAPDSDSLDSDSSDSEDSSDSRRSRRRRRRRKLRGLNPLQKKIVFDTIGDYAPENMKSVIYEDILAHMEQLEKQGFHLPKGYDKRKHAMSENEIRLFEQQMQRDKSRDQKKVSYLINFAALGISWFCQAMNLDWLKTKHLPETIRTALEEGEFNDCLEGIGMYLRGTMFDNPIFGSVLKFVEKMGEAHHMEMEEEHDKIEEEEQKRELKNAAALRSLNQLRQSAAVSGMGGIGGNVSGKTSGQASSTAPAFDLPAPPGLVGLKKTISPPEDDEEKKST